MKPSLFLGAIALLAFAAPAVGQQTTDQQMENQRLQLRLKLTEEELQQAQDLYIADHADTVILGRQTNDLSAQLKKAKDDLTARQKEVDDLKKGAQPPEKKE